jgi:hypothetical protein
VSRPVSRWSARGWLLGLALSLAAGLAVGPGACGAGSGRAVPAEVEIEWPDASGLGPAPDALAQPPADASPADASPADAGPP